MEMEAFFNGDLEGEIKKFVPQDITVESVLTFLEEKRSKSEYVYDSNYAREKTYLFMQQPFLIEKIIDTIVELLPKLEEKKAIEYGIVLLSKHLDNWAEPEEIFS